MRPLRRVQWRVVFSCAAIAVVAGVSAYLAAGSASQPGIGRIAAAIIAGALLSTLLVFGLGYYAAGRTARSLKLIAEGARRLAEGDLEYRVGPASTDETRELAEAIDSMASTIRDNVRNLSGERNKLSAVMNTMEDGVIVIEPDGGIALINQAAGHLLDAGAKDLVGNRLVEVVRDHELQQLISESLATKQPRFTELELLPRHRFISAIATPLDENGSEGVLLTLHDLSRIRRVETTRKEFVSNVSHELRSPLASIKAMVETLQDGAVADHLVARDFLKRINRAVDRMSSMVNDLLELSGLESGQASLHLRPLDVKPLVEELTSEVGERLAGKAVTVENSVPEDLPLVSGDEEKVRQVLVNLLENAVKFTPEHGGIAVSASADERFVEFYVSDTGAGIPAEHLGHVFERFYKVDRSRRDGGTGLGLAIVKHIVQASGGNVDVRSEEGSGSTFTFTLPRSS